MKRYFNMKTVYGIETVDELDSCDFESYRGFRLELKRLRYEYSIAGMNTYISSRSTKEWRES